MLEELTTQEDLLSYGDHLNELRMVLASAGLAILSMAGEVVVHVGELEGNTMAAFCRDVLKPVIETVDRELSEVSAKLDGTESEVTGLEALFKAAAVDPPARPGEAGYL